MKSYADKRRNDKTSDIDIGNRVYMKQPKINKLSTPFSQKLYTVIAKRGTMLTVCDDEKHYVTRNISFFKKVNMYECRVNAQDPPTPPDRHPAQPDTMLRQSNRVKTQSVLLRDYVV